MQFKNTIIKDLFGVAEYKTLADILKYKMAEDYS